MNKAIPFKTGYVTVVGRPNVGKSTLINALLGQKVAAVSPRPQTTRRRQLGILTLENAQVVFIDTPGIHKPVHKLGEYMNDAATSTLEDADVILWMVDASLPPTDEDQIVAERLAVLKNPAPILLVLNKSDLIEDEVMKERVETYQALFPAARLLVTSAATGLHKEELLDIVMELIPAGSAFFDGEQITDLYEREIAADLIRSAALNYLRDEVPHAMAVRIDEFKDRSDDISYIAATLMVEKESHKGIVIGQGGSMLKKIGTTARQEIETMTGHKIYLELRVKVNKNWRNDPDTLKRLGYSLEQEE